ncbi:MULTISPECIES: hypothetical protein [Erwiniaceae]|uniref:hypothetical protein n=1 Tax=Erwiniaceae TaxID=1903409 RepID=UPI0024B76271|nr:hypothetical protein [Pantoea ananatis]MDJ0033539.1 hypothetical protein [Pantoea ananatis]
MCIFLKTVPAAVSNLLQSVGINNALSLIMSPVLWLLASLAFLFLYLLKIVILWPLMCFTAMTAVITTLIPVLMLTNPLFTPDIVTHGIMRVFHQLPYMWLEFILLSFMTDMLLCLRREYNREFGRACGFIYKSGRGQASGSGLTFKQRADP